MPLGVVASRSIVAPAAGRVNHAGDGRALPGQGATGPYSGRLRAERDELMNSFGMSLADSHRA